MAEIHQLRISGLKSLFGAVPVIGTALNEALFDFRSRIKQERLESFVSELSQRVKELDDAQIDHTYLESEEFVDFLEALLQRVLRTRGEGKRRRLRDILVEQIQRPLATGFEESFLDLVVSVTESQIKILEAHRGSGGVIWKPRGHRHDDTSGRVLADFRSGACYGITEGEYRVLAQDLVSRALLYDDGMARVSIPALQVLEITALGTAFLEYIKGTTPGEAVPSH